MLNKTKMPHPLIIISQSDSLIQIVDTNSDTKWQTVRIHISWLLQKPADLDLPCLGRLGISGLARLWLKKETILYLLYILEHPNSLQ